jgi:uncharacterized membrane protein
MNPTNESRGAPQHPARHALARAAAQAIAAWALAGLATTAASPAQAAAAQSRWHVDLFPGLGYSFAYGINDHGTMVGLQDGQAAVFRPGRTDLLPPDVWSARAINNAGQVTGERSAGNNTSQIYRWDGQTFATIGPPGGPWAGGQAINASGQVAGYYQEPNIGQRAVVGNGSRLVDLTPPLAVYGVANGINVHGTIAGDVEFAGAAQQAFVAGLAAPTRLLGTLPGDLASGASAINARGWVTGWSYGLDTEFRAVLHRDGGWVELSQPGLTARFARSLNEQGRVVGEGRTLQGARTAFLHDGRALHDLNLMNGVIDGPARIENAEGVNNLGQIAVTTRAYGQDTAGRMSLVSNVWESTANGHWDERESWSHGIAPNRVAEIVIDPTRSLTVTGPSGQAEVARLQIGSAPGGGGGIATLRLAGGRISTLGAAHDEAGWQGVRVAASGVLTGDGTIRIDTAGPASLHNQGTLIADNLRIEGGGNAVIVNSGWIVGNTSGPARIAATQIQNFSGGRIRVLEGERLTLEASVAMLDGNLEVLGGQFTHIDRRALAVHSIDAQRGRVLAQDALLTFQGGLWLGGGQLAFTAGNSNLFGSTVLVTSANDGRSGQLLITGGAQATLYDGVDVGKGSELRVSAGATGTFLGLVRQRSGALFTGSGRKFYEGGLTIGDSPGLGIDEGDVEFGASNVYEAEIGGLVPGIEFDKYIVHGQLTFGGTLRLVPWAGFQPQVGQSFDLFDWGSTAGQFDAIDSSAFGHALIWDYSRLYEDGSISVTTVPEPGTWALLVLGCLFVAAQVQRRRSADAAGAGPVAWEDRP